MVLEQIFATLQQGNVRTAPCCLLSGDVGVAALDVTFLGFGGGGLIIQGLRVMILLVTFHLHGKRTVTLRAGLRNSEPLC